MNTQIVLASTWIGSNSRLVKTVVLFSMVALSLIGVGVVGAGVGHGGPDVP
jgi:hypothetical protein